MPLLQCPLCETPIIGSFEDLEEHVESDHALGTVFVNEQDYTNILDSIRSAKETQLKRRIEREMVVDE